MQRRQRRRDNQDKKRRPAPFADYKQPSGVPRLILDPARMPPGDDRQTSASPQRALGETAYRAMSAPRVCMHLHDGSGPTSYPPRRCTIQHSTSYFSWSLTLAHLILLQSERSQNRGLQKSIKERCRLGPSCCRRQVHRYTKMLVS